MEDLFNKLNTLLRANLNDVTSNIPGFERKKSLEKQVSDLRKRINDALATEDKIRAQIEDLHTTIETLDTAVDRAVESGQEDEARRLLEQLKRAEQRLTMAESDLRGHQRVAEELIIQVNMLDAKVADQKHADTQKQTTENPADTSNDNETESAKPSSESIDRLSGMLKQAQERTRERIQSIDEMVNQRQAQDASQQANAPQTPKKSVQSSSADKTEPDKKTDLESRINRLSNPKKS